MARTGKVRVEIEADARGFSKGTRDAERSLDRLNKSGSRSLAALKKAALGAGLAVGAGLAASMTVGTRELLEQEKASAQTEARLKSTGNAAKVTAQQVENLAAKLQAQTGIADDNIQSMQNMLLTFKGIRNEAGANNDIFNQATKATLDLSVAFEKGLSESAVLVGKALNDPIQGVTALRRVGVQLTEQQQDQVKAFVESGNVMAAQKLILAELNSQVGGSAKAFGDTMAGQVEKSKRQFEDLTEALAAKVIPVVVQVAEFIRRNWPAIERVTRQAFEGARRAVEVAIKWIDANVVPTIRSIVRNAQRFWNAFGDDITEVFGFIVRHIQRALTIVGAIIKGVLAVLRGDWSEAWKNLKTVVVTVFEGIKDFLRTIPAAVGRIALNIGKALGRGILNGLKALGDEIKDFILGLIPGPLRRFIFGGTSTAEATEDLERFFRPSRTRSAPAAGGGIPRAMGGTVPGRRGQAVPITAHAGEVVLNPGQQRMVGIDRIVAVLRATGGVIGGDSFAAGGVVSTAGRFALAQVGEPYVWGGGHSFGDSYGWDCSGFASNVAAHVPGYTGGIGTTMSLRPASTRPKGGEPVLFGFRGIGKGARGEHMGVWIKDYGWFDAGSGGVQRGDSRWEQVLVPPGLAGLTDSPRSIASAGDPKAAPQSTKTAPTPLQKTTELLKKLGIGKPLAAAKSLLGGVPDLSEGSAPGFTPAQDRSVSRAGREARAAARASGASPEEVARAGDEAERNEEIRLLRAQVASARKDLRRLMALKRKTWVAFTKLGRKKVGPKNRAAKRRLMAQYRKKLKAIDEELSEVREEIAQLNERLMEIGEQIAQEQYEASFSAADAGAAETSAADTTATEAAPGPTPDQQAQIDQANRRADVAENDARNSAAFIQALRTSRDIDPAAGGGVTVIVNGSLVREREVGAFVIDALGHQGHTTSPTLASSA